MKMHGIAALGSGPRIVSVVVDEGASTHRVNAAGTPVTLLTSTRAVVTLGNLIPGSTVEVTRGSMDLSVEQSCALAAIPVTTRCRANFGGYRMVEPRRSVLRATASRAGTATLDFSLNFALPDDGSAVGTSGPCSGPLAFRISPPAKGGVLPNRPATSGGEVQFLMTPAFTIRPWTVYRYENTAQLGSIFNFTMKGEGASLCSGTSPGPRSFPIGQYERGGDLAVQIRSGPLGTVCKAISPGVLLPSSAWQQCRFARYIETCVRSCPPRICLFGRVQRAGFPVSGGDDGGRGRSGLSDPIWPHRHPLPTVHPVTIAWGWHERDIELQRQDDRDQMPDRRAARPCRGAWRICPQPSGRQGAWAPPGGANRPAHPVVERLDQSRRAHQRRPDQPAHPVAGNGDGIVLRHHCIERPWDRGSAGRGRICHARWPAHAAVKPSSSRR